MKKITPMVRKIGLVYMYYTNAQFLHVLLLCLGVKINRAYLIP